MEGVTSLIYRCLVPWFISPASLHPGMYRCKGNCKASIFFLESFIPSVFRDEKVRTLATLDVPSFLTRCCLATAMRCCCPRLALQWTVTRTMSGRPRLSTPCWAPRVPLTGLQGYSPWSRRLPVRPLFQNLALCQGGRVPGDLGHSRAGAA